MSLIPRPYQERAIDYAVRYAVANIRGRLLIVGPPGSGKTVIYSHVLRLLVAEQGLRGLVWAHRRELIGQAYDHLIECGVPQHFIGVVMAGDKRENPRAPIQVASVETLHRRTKPLADVIVSDEAHRDASDGRRKLRALYPDAFHLGFTATPTRLDGRGLAGDYDELFIAAQPSELIADGHIVAPKIYTVPPEMLPDLKKVRTLAGDYREDDLERATNRAPLVGNAVSEWKRLADGRRTMAFPVSIKHSRNVVASFNAAGITTAHIDGDTPQTERQRALAKLANGSLSLVSSCGVLSEGTNIPSVKCALILRATKSLALHVQQPGRTMRPWDDVEALVLDHAGNTLRLGLPHADRSWELTVTKAKQGRYVVPVKACPCCQLVLFAGTAKCDGCGAQVGGPAKDPSELKGELTEYRQQHLKEQMDADLLLMKGIETQRGFREGWADRVHQAKYATIIGR